MSQNTTISLSKADAIHWLLVLILPAIFGGITYALGFDYKIIAFIALTTVGLTCWGFELLPDALVGMALPILYIVFGVAPAPAVLAPWTGSVGWWIAGGMIIGAFFMKTGLSRRLALHCINLVGKSFLQLMFGLLLAGLILALFLPSAMARAAVLVVLCVGICDTLDIKKGSKEGATIIFSGFIAVAASKICYMSGGVDVIMSMKLVSAALNQPMQWMEYAQHNFIPAVIYSIMSILCVYFVMRPSIKGNMREIVRPQLDALGPMSFEEKKAAVLLVILCACLLTDKYHGIDAGWLMLLIATVAFLPGVNLLNGEDFKRVNFPVVVFTVGCMTIGSTAAACGMDKVASAALVPILSGSEFFTVIMSYIAGASLNFVLTPLPATAMLTTTIVDMAQNMSINPLLLVYPFNYGLDQYLFPYEHAVLVFFYSSGYIKIRQVTQIFGVRMLLTAVFIAVVAYPYWKFVM